MEHLKLEHQICFPLYAASRLVMQLYQPVLAPLDITYPQYLVFLLLWERDHRSVSEIGKCLVLESSTLTPLLKRLEAKELIERNRSEADERSVIISLTEKGLQMRNLAADIPEKVTGQLQSGQWQAEEVIHLKSMLTALVRQLASSQRKN
jgi:DNA-binding MarR family transcriptional regulator